MTALFTYARNADTDAPMFAAVADDKGADYVFPPGVEPWLDMKQRLPFLLGDSEPPTDAEGWLALATTNFGYGTSFDPPFDDASTLKQATALASKYLSGYEKNNTDPKPNAALIDARDAYDQAAADYPELGDDETVLDNPEAMDNMVLMALGPIDPEGPNGWILRAMDGNPRPGDENEYVHFPGTIDSSGDEPEAVDNSDEETTEPTDNSEPEAPQ